MITGARQVGKTTLARQFYSGVPYINLDAMENRETLKSIPTALWAREIGPAVLDEAHKEPSVFEKVKYAYDAGEVNFTVLLGSAQILMLESIRETLAGRVFVYEMWPLTLAEIAAGPVEPAEPLLVRLLKGSRSIAETLATEPRRAIIENEVNSIEASNHLQTWGGMPELLRLNDIERRDWLRSYHETYLMRDLADLVRLRDLEPFSRFQRLAALRTGSLLSFSELARDAGTSTNTARNYLEYLRISFQAFLLQPFRENLTSSVIKTPKLFWADVGIARHLGGVWGPISGSLFETMVVSEAVKLVRTLGMDFEPFFYRTRSGMEVDLLLSGTDRVLCIEAKARDSARLSDLRSIKALKENLGSRFLGGIVVTTGRSLEPLTEDGSCWAVPVHRLFA